MTEFRDRLHDLGDDPRAQRPLEDLDVVLSRVRGRRRRRALALSGVAAVAAVGIWVGGSTLAVGLRQPQVVPGETTTPSTGATASAETSTEPSTPPVALPGVDPRAEPGRCGFALDRTAESAPAGADPAVHPTLPQTEVKTGTSAPTVTSVGAVAGRSLTGLTVALATDDHVVASTDVAVSADLTDGATVAAWAPAGVCGDGPDAGSAVPAGTYQVVVVARLDDGTALTALVGPLRVIGTSRVVHPVPEVGGEPALPPLGWMELVCGSPAPDWPDGSPLRVDLDPVTTTTGPDGETRYDIGSALTYTGPGTLGGVSEGYVAHWLLRDGVVVGGSEVGPGDAGLTRVVLPTGLTVPWGAAPTTAELLAPSCGGDPLPPGDYELVVISLVLDPQVTLPDGTTFRPDSAERVLRSRSAPVPITITD